MIIKKDLQSSQSIVNDPYPYKLKDQININLARIRSKAFNNLLGNDFCFKNIDDLRLNNNYYIQKKKKLAREMTSLVHLSRPGLEENIVYLHNRVQFSVSNKQSLPVIRFADGEYSFYVLSMACNGLYLQAENKSSIIKAIPRHIKALKYVEKFGVLSPLIFPGNLASGFSIRKFLKIKEHTGSSLGFLEFLASEAIELRLNNYVPFYTLYAYLSSRLFLDVCDGRNICVVNSDFDPCMAQKWFTRTGKTLNLYYIKIPSEFIATSWADYSADIIAKIPADPDLFLVGAGVGALEICAELSRHFSVPAIDGGHILNIINGMVEKSAGNRLFTEWT